MIQSIEFIVPGQPVGKGRPRGTKNGHFYTPAKTRAYEEEVKTAYVFSGGIKMDGAIRVDIKAVFQIPKSTPKKIRQEMMKEEVLHTKKCDADNIAKIILDSLNKIAFDDDSQVAELVIKKVYGEKPLVYVVLSGLT